MGRKRLYQRSVTFRVNKEQHNKIMKDAKKNGNVGNVMRRILDEHYLFKYRIRNNLTGLFNFIYGGIMMNKKIMALIGTVAIAAMLFGLGLQPVIYQAPITQHTYLDGIMSVHHNGILVDRKHNTLMDTGANGIRDYLTKDGTVNAINEIAVGNGSEPVAGSTSLDSEIAECGFTQAVATLGTQATGNWSYEYTFTSTGCAGITVNTSAMFNATGATEVIFWGDDFTDTTLQVSDTLKITWNVSVAGA